MPKNFGKGKRLTKTSQFNQTVKQRKEMDAQSIFDSKSKNQEIQEQYIINQYYFKKSCEKCKSPHFDDFMLLCDICDDAFHIYCLSEPLTSVPPEDEDWYCPSCAKRVKEIANGQNKENKNIKSKSKQTNLNGLFTSKPKKKVCYKCKKNIKFDEKNKKAKNEFEKFCVKCSHYFHSRCFNNQKDKIVCNSCDKKVRESLNKNDQTLFKFFGNTKQQQTIKRKQKKIKKLCYSKQKKAQFKVQRPVKNQKLQEKLSFALAFGLKVKGLSFSDDLGYSKACPTEANNVLNFEDELQKISKENLKVFQKFKQLTRKGLYAPMLVVEHEIQGFIVKAAQIIPKFTLLCEYVGEVDYSSNRLFDNNDSLMQLLKTPHSKTSLLICPEKRGNIARFLSGINNQSNSSIIKQNVRSIRFNINNQARIVLYAKRQIKKNEILYYDYNEGGFNQYDTKDFV